MPPPTQDQALDDQRFRELTELFTGVLRRHGLLASDEEAIFTPLSGGISSDIFKVSVPGGSYCIKRALPKLRVEKDWRAPPRRAQAEAAWLAFMAEVAPANAPRLLASAPEFDLFVMEYLEPATHPVWKAELSRGRIDPGFAAAVGRALGQVHQATAGNPRSARTFADDEVIRAMRFDPYFGGAAAENPDCAAALAALSRDTLAVNRVMVHGDISPKNILIGPLGPVFLDGETAWHGDPAFDYAFCLNHLLLKCIWRPQWSEGYLRCAEDFSAGYRGCVDWEEISQLEARAARLLAALLLARIDGKSPVEYITETNKRALVRNFAKPFILAPAPDTALLRHIWTEMLNRAALPSVPAEPGQDSN